MVKIGDDFIWCLLDVGEKLLYSWISVNLSSAITNNKTIKHKESYFLQELLCNVLLVEIIILINIINATVSTNN